MMTSWLLPTLFTMVVIGIPVMLIHELAHVSTAMGLNVKVKTVGITWRGIYTRRELGTDVQNLAISLAGPAVNLLFVLILWNQALSGLASDFFVANLLIFGINILPISGSDGDRAWACLVRILNPDKREAANS